MNVEHECKLLVQEMKRLGEEKDGQYVVTFGVMFNDTRCANIFEGIIYCQSVLLSLGKTILTF